GDTGMALALAGPNRRYGHGLGRARLSADVETDPCVFVTGETASSDFAPISETAFQQAYGGGQSEAFGTQLDIGVDSVDCPECVPKLTDGSYNNLTGQVHLTWDDACPDTWQFVITVRPPAPGSTWSITLGLVTSYTIFGLAPGTYVIWLT